MSHISGDSAVGVVVVFTNGYPNKNKYSIWVNYHFDMKQVLKSYIDCGTNEELFLSLAALRDDTDRHQWFIDDNTSIWERSNDELPSRYMQMEGHKASVEEIIKHFTVEGGVV